MAGQDKAGARREWANTSGARRYSTWLMSGAGPEVRVVPARVWTGQGQVRNDGLGETRAGAGNKVGMRESLSYTRM